MLILLFYIRILYWQALQAMGCSFLSSLLLCSGGGKVL
jgi:hypothetical protein